MMFLMISQLNDPLQKKKLSNICSQLIHMTFQEGLVIKDIYIIIL
jgi:hypothetical protein